MNNTRTLIKKIIYKVLGETTYRKAYVKGKVMDIKNGTLDEVEISFLKHFIKKDSMVLDIGANYGHYAIDMSKLCYEGKVLAFEPVPFTFDVLKDVVNKFSFGEIEVYHNAVSNQKSNIEMTVPLLDFGAPNTGVAYIGNSTEAKSKTVKVKSIKIDDLTINSKIDFIKIDIEGHEPFAFEGMINLLAKDRPVILIEFSYSCLKRASFNPESFANDIKNKYNYAFTFVQGDKLKIVPNLSIPKDGYYFLIPSEKMNDFNTIIV